jgi:hypothetical protein
VPSKQQAEETPLNQFGKLTGIRYDSQENALYLNDYDNDKIQKLQFSNYENLKMASLEPILKSEYLSTSISRINLNPIMSFQFENYIYWADYANGVRVNLYNSTCFRTIYKVVEPMAMRLVFITSNSITYARPSTSFTENADSDELTLKVINGNKFKYPPDYYSYHYSYFLNGSLTESKRVDAAALNNNSRKFNSFFSKSYFIFILMIYFITKLPQM